MTHPVYVLLPDGVEWTAVPGTTSQTPRPIRWYLRTMLPSAATQVAVLVADDAAIDQVVTAAEALGGIAVDAATQTRLHTGQPVI